MSNYEAPKHRQNGEPVIPREIQIQTVTCCDCGLTHLVIYEVEGDYVTVTHYGDPYTTQKERERKSVKVVSTKKGAKSG